MLIYLGPEIRERRKEKHLKVFELAQRIGIAANTVTMIEKCQRLPSEEVLEKIIKALGRDFKTAYYRDKYADVIIFLKDNPNLLLIEAKHNSSHRSKDTKTLLQAHKYLRYAKRQNHR